jgi:hypothetical protein
VPKSNFFSTSKSEVTGQLSDVLDIVGWVTLDADSPLVATEFEQTAAWAPRFASPQNQPIEFLFEYTLNHCIYIHIHQSAAESDAAFVRRFLRRFFVSAVDDFATLLAFLSLQPC